MVAVGQLAARGRLDEMREPPPRRKRLDDCSRPRIALWSDRKQKHDVRCHDRPNRNAGQACGETARRRSIRAIDATRLTLQAKPTLAPLEPANRKGEQLPLLKRWDVLHRLNIPRQIVTTVYQTRLLACFYFWSSCGNIFHFDHNPRRFLPLGAV